MCQLISWVERRNKVYFLTRDRISSRKGQQIIREQGISSDDYCGHGTTRAFYGIDTSDGENEECTDFSETDNFPDVIVEALKAGKFRGMGVIEGVLTPDVWADYDKANHPLRADYEKARQASFWDLFAINENRQPQWR